MTNYEFHITVKNAHKESFIDFCKEINVKPIILELYLNDSILFDVMTSHTKRLNNDHEAYLELNRIKLLLTNQGFNVVREKIEADYTHPEVPTINSMLRKDNQKYLESHLNIEVTKESEQLLKSLLIPLGFHISRNIFKKVSKNTFILMATYRTNDKILSDFKDYLNKSVILLKENNFNVNKVITEYAIYDSNVKWDTKWLKEIKNDNTY